MPAKGVANTNVRTTRTRLSGLYHFTVTPPIHAPKVSPIRPTSASSSASSSASASSRSIPPLPLPPPIMFEERDFVGTHDEAFEELQEEIKTLFPATYARRTREYWRRATADLRSDGYVALSAWSVDITNAKQEHTVTCTRLSTWEPFVPEKKPKRT